MVMIVMVVIMMMMVVVVIMMMMVAVMMIMVIMMMMVVVIMMVVMIMMVVCLLCFQVGGYDPSKFEAMLLSTCGSLVDLGGGGPEEAVRRLTAMHSQDDLYLPGGGGSMNNFRKNPMVDSPWAGGMHRVLIDHGVIRKIQSPAVHLLLSPSQHVQQPISPLQGASGGDVYGTPQGKASLSNLDQPGTPAGSIGWPKVVTEDAKFLHLDGRINELESKAADGGGTEPHAFDVHIESLRSERLPPLCSFSLGVPRVPPLRNRRGPR